MANQFNNPYNTLYGYQQQPNYQYQQPVVDQSSGGGGGNKGGMASAIGQGVGGLVQVPFGIVQAIKGNRDRKRAEAQSEQELNSAPVYETSPYAQRMLAQAQGQVNAINPAVAALQQQALQQQANATAATQRNASSGAEAIQAAIMAQNVANSNAPSIAQLQAQYAQRNQGLLADAMQTMTGEYQNVFNDRVRRNDNRLNFRLGQLAGANKRFGDGFQNIIGGAQGIGSAAGAIATGGI